MVSSESPPQTQSAAFLEILNDATETLHAGERVHYRVHKSVDERLEELERELHRLRGEVESLKVQEPTP
jgi:hypothetical protein